MDPLSKTARRQAVTLSSLLALLMLTTACTPTVQIAAPSDPITINLNVKIEHEILVKVDREIDTLLEENSDLF